MAGLDLTGKTAIVTGASRGIGLATAQAIAAAGGNVVLTSRSQESADAAAAQVNGNAIGVGAHATDEDAARKCVEQTIERFGSLDILVNNAGTNPSFGPIINQDHSRFAKTFDVNVWAPVLWTGLAARAWMGEHGGSVVNTASIGGMAFEAGIGTYNASKAALIHITKQLALELSPKIRVNAVAPGVVRTKLAEALWKEHEEAVSASTALGRIGEPEDVAAAIAFLVSDAAQWITGEIMTIDGGQLLGDALPFRQGASVGGWRRSSETRYRGGHRVDHRTGDRLFRAVVLRSNRLGAVEPHVPGSRSGRQSLGATTPTAGASAGLGSRRGA